MRRTHKQPDVVLTTPVEYIDEVFTPQDTDILQQPPQELLNTCLLHEYVINHGTTQTQPNSAFAITLMLIQDLAKENTTTPDRGGRSSHFSYFIAPTGQGKQTVPYLYSKLLKPSVGGWHSNQGLMTKLQEDKMFISITEEAEMIHKKLQGNEHGFRGSLLNGYTTGPNNPITSDTKSDGTAPITIDDKAVTLIMTTVPESCFIFDSDSYRNTGVLNRHTLWYPQNPKLRGQKAKSKPCQVPKRIHESYYTKTTPWTQEAEDCYYNTIGDLETFDTDIYNIAKSLNNAEEITRYREQALRLATAIAWFEKSQITLDLLLWCYNIIKFTNLSTLELLKQDLQQQELPVLENFPYSIDKLKNTKMFKGKSTEQVYLTLELLLQQSQIQIFDTKTGETFGSLPRNADNAIRKGGRYTKDYIIKVNPDAVDFQSLREIKLLPVGEDFLIHQDSTSFPTTVSQNFSSAMQGGNRDKAVDKLEVLDFKKEYGMGLI